MQSFIHRKNVEHYRKLLEQTTNDAERRQIQRLLAEEEAKFEAHRARELGDRGPSRA